MYKQRGTMGLVLSVLAAVMAIALIAASSQLFENVGASDVVVIQSRIDGELRVISEPGPVWQGFGIVTTYRKRDEYAFNKGCKNESKDDSNTTPKGLRFNDGGTAEVCGSIQWEMPLEPKLVLKLHEKFSTQNAVMAGLIGPAIDNAAITSGPTMSSTESSGERRSELLQIFDDQARNGVFETSTDEVKQKDQLTGTEKLVSVMKIVRDETGKPKRRLGSAVSDYGIKFFPMTISDIRYDDVVKGQIAKRQDAITAVQTSQANSQRAEQDTKTTIEQGKADAAKAKWEQEAINAKEIAEAEKQVTVAKLEVQAAELNKRKSILEGEGEAARKRLVMEADGALSSKLEAWKEVNKAYAAAIKDYQGNWVPQVSMGSNGSGTSSAQSLMDAMMVKTMRDLAIDVTPNGIKKTTKAVEQK